MAIDTAISNDNKYLSIAEINTQGAVIQSNIKIISIEKARTDPTNSVIYTYNLDANKLVTNIQYQDKNNLLISYDNGIYVLKGENVSESVLFEKSKVTFASVVLNNYSVYTIERKVSFLNTNTQVVLKNSSTERENIYTANGVVKDMKTCGDNIALNLGSQIDFINTNGWLVKRYISQKEVNDIVVSERIAGIIYKDKIEITSL